MHRLAVFGLAGARLGAGGGRDFRGSDEGGSGGRRGLSVVILEQQRRQLPAHVRGHVIGVRPHPPGEPVVDVTDVEVDRLERAAGALDVGAKSTPRSNPATYVK